MGLEGEGRELLEEEEEEEKEKGKIKYKKKKKKEKNLPGDVLAMLAWGQKGKRDT